MPDQTRRWERNIAGLQQTAQAKAVATRQRAEEAIQLLLKEKRPINFKTVAETAHVSTAWLYGQEDIKQRILDLRSQQEPKPKIVIPPHERASDASKDALIAVLRKRVKEQEEQIRDLKKQVEVAYGQLYQKQE
jgi:hypothetical protein